MEKSANPVIKPIRALSSCGKPVEDRGIACGKFFRFFQHPVEKPLLCLWKTFFRAVRYFRRSSKMFATRADVFEVIMLFKNNTSPI